MRQKVLKGLLRFGVPAVLVGFAFSRIDFAEAARELRSTMPLMVALALGLLAISLLLRLVRWRASLNALGIPHSRRALLRSYALGFAGSAVVGEGVGALGRTYDLKADGASAKSVLTALVLDKGYEVVTLVALVTPATLVLPSSAIDTDPAVIWTMGLLATIAVVTPFTPLGARAIGSFARRFDGKNRPLGRLAEALGGVRTVDHLWILSLSVAARVAQFAYAWYLARSVDVDIGFLELSAVMTAVGFVVLLPISIGGLGVRDVTMLGLFEALDRSATSAVTVSLLIFITTMLSRVAVGIAWALTRTDRQSALDPRSD